MGSFCSSLSLIVASLHQTNCLLGSLFLSLSVFLSLLNFYLFHKRTDLFCYTISNMGQWAQTSPSIPHSPSPQHTLTDTQDAPHTISPLYQHAVLFISRRLPQLFISSENGCEDNSRLFIFCLISIPFPALRHCRSQGTTRFITFPHSVNARDPAISSLLAQDTLLRWSLNISAAQFRWWMYILSLITMFIPQVTSEKCKLPSFGK